MVVTVVAGKWAVILHSRMGLVSKDLAQVAMAELVEEQATEELVEMVVSAVILPSLPLNL